MPQTAGLYYALHEGGSRELKPVILIHGAGSSHLCWPAVLRRLPGRTVIALDLPGHGRSEGVGAQSVGMFAEAVIELMAALGMYQAVFAGHSLGGAVALSLALDFPEHTAGLGLFASGASFNVPQELLDLLGSPVTAGEGRALLQRRLLPANADSVLAQKVACGLEDTRPGVLYGDWLACAHFDVRSRVPGLQTPAYLACGQRDCVTPPAFSRFLAGTLPGARLDLLPDAGHMLPLEQPLALAAGFTAFLAELDRWYSGVELPIRLPQTRQNPADKKKDLL